MAERIMLSAKPREAGAKPRALRRAGWIPAVLYGQHYATRHLQIAEQDLQQILRSVGTTRLLHLAIEGQPANELVLVREVQRDSVTGRLLHIDLYRTIADQPITTTVPLVAEGEAPATELGLVVNQLLDQLEIQCLPRDLPAEIRVNLGLLTDLDSAILISDLDIPPGVTVLNDPDTPVARMVIPRAAIEEEEAEAALAEEGEEAEQAEEPADDASTDAPEESE